MPRGGEAIVFRVGVDIGGTFTDIVFLDDGGRLHTKKVSSSVDDYARAIVDGLARDLPRHGHRRARTSPRCSTAPPSPRTPSSSRRGARTGLITTRGLPRRPRDPPSPHAAALRPHLGEAGAARRALPAPGGDRAHRRARRRPDAARPRRRSSDALERLRREGVEALAVCLINSYANPAHEEQIKARGQPARAGAGGLLQRRGPAGDPGVRAHVDHGDQRLRDADRPPLPGHAAGRPRRRRA